MIRTSRREALMGALAAPALAGVPRWKPATGAVLVHDPALGIAQRLVEAHRGEVLAIEGDRIRFARAVFERRPALVVGLSRRADALLIEDVGREAGYRSTHLASEGLRELLAQVRSRETEFVLVWGLAPKV